MMAASKVSTLDATLKRQIFHANFIAAWSTAFHLKSESMTLAAWKIFTITSQKLPNTFTKIQLKHF